MIERVTAGAALQAVVNALAGRRGLEEVLQTILAQSRAMLGVAAVAMLWREGDQLVLRAADGFTLPDGARISVPWGSGIEGWAAARDEAVTVPDAARDPRLVRLSDRLGPIGGVIAVPIRLRGDVTGVIAAYRRERGHFVEVDRWWLDILGSLAAATIESDRAYRSEQRRARQAEILLELETLEHSDLSNALQGIADRLNHVLDVDKTDVMLVDDERGELVSIGISGALAPVERQRGLDRLRLGEPNPIVDVFATGRPYYCRDTSAEPGCEPFAELHVSSMLAAPISASGRIRGVLHLATSVPGTFGPDDLAFLVLIAARIGLMIERSELRQRQSELERRRLQAQAREEFLGVVSHELKTPVTVIQAYTELLHRRAERSGNTGEMDVLARVAQQCERMLVLIEQLLDLQRIETGVLPLEPSRFDLTELAAHTVETLQLTTHRHRLVLEPAPPVPLLADRRRIEQVLVNLLENAIKYSPNGGDVRVSVETREEPDSSGERQPWAVVTVRDQGIGIAPDELTNVFARFYQAGPRLHRGHVGLGLGLSISRELVRRHGGEIWAESQQGIGSAFAFKLPGAGAPPSPTGGSQG